MSDMWAVFAGCVIGWLCGPIVLGWRQSRLYRRSQRRRKAAIRTQMEGRRVRPCSDNPTPIKRCGKHMAQAEMAIYEAGRPIERDTAADVDGAAARWQAYCETLGEPKEDGDDR